MNQDFEKILAYDDGRDHPASERARTACRAIWDKPHMAPVIIQGLIDELTKIPEPRDELPEGWATMTRVDVAEGDELDTIGLLAGKRRRGYDESDDAYRLELKAPDLCSICKEPLVEGDAMYAGVAHWACAHKRGW